MRILLHEAIFLGIKIQYFIESKRGKLDDHSHFYPIGVWVKSLGPGFDIKFAFLTGHGHDEQKIKVEMTVLRAMAAGLKKIHGWVHGIPPRSLERIQRRSWSDETDVYDTLVECAEAVLGMICKHYEENPPDDLVNRRVLF